MGRGTSGKRVPPGAALPYVMQLCKHQSRLARPVALSLNSHCSHPYADDRAGSRRLRGRAQQARTKARSEGRKSMPIDKRVGSAAEALAGVKDGATVLISGFGGGGFPNML